MKIQNKTYIFRGGMKKMKKLVALTLIIIIVLSMAACTSRTTEKQEVEQQGKTKTESSTVGNSKKDQLYIEVSALGNIDYFYDHKMGMKKAGEELGVRTEYVGPAE